MSNKPFRFGGYEIDRAKWNFVENEVRVYPIKKERFELLQAKWEERDPVDYDSYRSPEAGGQPGAPEKVGNPTLQRLVDMETYLEEKEERRYLEQWLKSMDKVLEERLDSLQRKVIEQYAMQPKSRRPEITKAMGDDASASQSQCYEWLNTALLEFAFLLLDSRSIRVIAGKTPENGRKNSGKGPEKERKNSGKISA